MFFNAQLIIIVVMDCLFVVGARVPLEIDKLKKDFRDMDAELVEKLEMTDDKQLLLQKFYEFDQIFIKPASKKHVDPFLNATEFSTKILRYYLQEIEMGYNKSLTKLSAYKDKVFTSDTKLELNYYIWRASRLVQTSLKDVYDILEDVLSKTLKELNQTWCSDSNDTSTYTTLFQIYNAIALGEFKNYFMLRLLNMLNDKPVDDRKLLVRTKKIFIKVTKGVTMRLDIRRCDPYRFVKEENVLQFTKLLQGFLINIDGDRLTQTKLENRCAGDQITECTAVSSSGRVCISSFKHKRYDFIEQSSKELLGKAQYCSASKLKQWNGKNSLCLCDDFGTKSDRFISLRMLSSNTQNNSVITGLKFTKHNRVLHLQIQEGRLLSYGSIDENSIRWVPIVDFKITDNDIYNERDIYSLTNRSRTMAIDEFFVEEDNYVITGMGFQIVNGKLQLVAKVTEYDYLTGKLNIMQTKTLQNKAVNRKYFIPENADIPTYTDKNSEMLFNEPIYLKFTHTDVGKDVAQTTIPFFDAQEVTSSPASPLVGAGIFYKGRVGYGGFIAPVIKIINKLDF